MSLQAERLLVGVDAAPYAHAHAVDHVYAATSESGSRL